jgi:hypothetical protein
MASGTTTPDKPIEPRQPPAQRDEGYIEQRIVQTGRHLKSVDAALALMTLATGALAYLLVAAVFDQWLIRGGLGLAGRLLFWAVLVCAGGYYIVRRVAPPLVRRINPIFAADTIEKSRPTLKNSLINFLLLRDHRGEMSQVIYQALQQRAAADLTQVRPDTAVDRARVVRLGYVLAGTLTLFCLYLVFSPKSMGASVTRVLWPWARIAAPTRVTIEDVSPGDAEKFIGEFAAIAAKVKGLREGEQATLHYTTADGQSVNQAITMNPAEGPNRYSATLPPGAAGLQQDYTYQITAGDGATQTYKLAVLIPPAITVDAIEYHYPPYTGLADRKVERQGDIRALEGTEVTIHATANQDIKEARIDFGSDSIQMKARGTQATGRFTLRLNKDDPPRTEHDWYQIRFTSAGGKPNRWPSRYGIEVLADRKPEVELIAPSDEETRMPQNESLEIRVRAKDPDFALRLVSPQARQRDQNLPLPALLDKPSPDEPFAGEFQGSFVFEPAKLGLKPGDRVQYWIDAEDNKEPEANRSSTRRQWISIVGNDAPTPAERKPSSGSQQPKGSQSESKEQPNELTNRGTESQKPQPQKPENNPQGKKEPPQKPKEEPKDSSNGDQQPDQTDQSAQSKDQGNSADGAGKGNAKSGAAGDQSAGQSENKSDPIDPANDGKAIAAINEHRREEQKKQDNPQPINGDKQDNQKQGGKPDNQGEGGAGEKTDQQDTGSKQDNQTGSGKSPNQQGKGKSDQQKEPGKSDQQKGSPNSTQQQGGGDQSKQPDENAKSDQQQNGEKSEQPKTGAKTGQKQTQDNAGPQQDPAKTGQKTDSGKSGDQKDSANQDQKGKTTQQEQKGKNGQKDQPDATGKQQENSKPDPQDKSGKQQETGKKNDTQGAGKKPNQQPSEGGAGAKQDTKKSDNQDSAKSDQQKTGEKGDNQQGSPKTEKKQPAEPSAKDQASSKSDQQTSGAKQDTKKSDNQDTAKSDQQKTGEKGDNQQGSGKPEKKQPTDSSAKDQASSKSDQQPNAPKSKTGKTGDGDKGNPEQQANNQAPQKKPAEEKSTPESKTGEPASPSTSPKPSDPKTKGIEGDRSGEGNRGGGQQSKQDGQGSAGSTSPADRGGSPQSERGRGATGTRPGEEVQSKDKTGGKSTIRRDGDGSSTGEAEASDRIGKTPLPKDIQTPGKGSQTGDLPGGSAGKDAPDKDDTQAKGNPNAGGSQGKTDEQPAPSKEPSGGEDPNLEYARMQTDLALEHLKDQLAQEKPGLLDRLGWTKEEAKKFLDKWEQLMHNAQGGNSQTAPAKKDLDEALKSLGLKPQSTSLRGGQTKQDRTGSLREAGRFAPSPEWADQIRAYQKGVAEGGK